MIKLPSKEKIFFLKNIFIKGVIWFFIISVFITFSLKYINPPVTSLMVLRLIDPVKPKGKRRIVKRWIPYAKISQNMVRAAVAGEDNNFALHHGVDLEAIGEAVKYNKKLKNKNRKRGASTISQQTAKNLFLWPSRSYLRKGLELYFTFLIEMMWSKKRIMEVYLNVIEVGNGIYGVEAAARYYYKKRADNLTRSEAALIAASFPSPLQNNPAKPGNYLVRRQQLILRLMEINGRIKLE